MARKSIFVVIMAGGRGTRMRATLPKILHSLGGLPLGAHVTRLAENLAPADILCLIPPFAGEEKDDGLKNLFYPHRLLVQGQPLGTGHAAKLAAQEFEKKAMPDNAVVLFLCGDSPLFEQSTIEQLVDSLDGEAGRHDLALLAFQSGKDYNYGRLQIKNNQVMSIVEAKDASAEDKKINIFNSGVMAVRWHLGRETLLDHLEKITDDNRAGEYYLTDLVKMVSNAGLKTTYCLTGEDECLGVNSQADLAQAEKTLQNKWREQFMSQGVTMPDPASVFFSHDTAIEPDVTIEPFVVIKNGVNIERGAVIKSFSHLAEATIGKNAVVGPYARLRPGAKILAEAHVGNFVEIKNATLGYGAKANHLTYLGDSEVGDGVNIGAGTITCNYDGQKKSKTIIGKNAFIGSNSSLVAPVKIGEGAVVAAGSVITEDVARDALAITRGQQMAVAGYRQKKWQNKK
ncbi:MAG: bifunctional UDP-N-acetylglucosamine diphosphorylase/glucosamine-1-phosphate N-acetyltransferase GlmU [Hydrotalea sp.]|nr:bifunctional UDP-N-acetylglucosamine diphosphorylase/glucosamine-1-phosphate N-acetyltransferase GlmU [Hydrotalea sp.]